MNVICIKSTKKLVKNATYKVAKLNNSNTQSNRYFRPTITIYLSDNIFASFPLESFKPSVGDTFQTINWVSQEYSQFLTEREQTQITKDLKVGEYVVPKYDSLKTLIRGRKYKVTDVKINSHKNHAGIVTYSSIEIKLEGSNRYYSSHNFRKCTQQEMREIGLNELFDEKNDTEKVNRFRRKFDYLTPNEKKIVLLKHIISSANDRFRNSMDIIEWTIEKTGKTYNLKTTDFDDLKSLTFSEIIDLLK
jgi:hypothetical protein